MYIYDGCYLFLCLNLLKITCFTDSFTKPSRTFMDTAFLAKGVNLPLYPNIPQKQKWCLQRTPMFV